MERMPGVSVASGAMVNASVAVGVGRSEGVEAGASGDAVLGVFTISGANARAPAGMVGFAMSTRAQCISSAGAGALALPSMDATAGLVEAKSPIRPTIKQPAPITKAG